MKAASRESAFRAPDTAKDGDDRRMTIWFISAYDAPEGQSSRTHDFAMELAERGHRVWLFTSSYSHLSPVERLHDGENWREETVGPIHVCWLRTFHYKGNGLRRGLHMLSNAYRALSVGGRMAAKPDIIVGPSVPLFTALAAYLLAKLKGSQFVFEVRDVWPQALIDLGVLSPRNPVTWVLRAIEVFLYKRARMIVAVLPLAHQHICAYGIQRDRVVWVPNGVQLRRYEGTQAFNGGSRNALTVMYVGGFSATHDVDTIVEAAVRLKDRNVTFIVIGAGESKTNCEHLAQARGLENIVFRERVEKCAIPRTLQTADLLIAVVKDTPVYQFGINSNKIYDYLGSGRPIIFAGRAPNNPVADADAGLTVAPQDPAALAAAVVTFLEMDPLERKRLGDNGRRYAEKFLDTSILVRKLEAVFRRALDGTFTTDVGEMKS
jgi:glycosyltransferase involved in cell wall biosynthesis